MEPTASAPMQHQKLPSRAASDVASSRCGAALSRRRSSNAAAAELQQPRRRSIAAPAALHCSAGDDSGCCDAAHGGHGGSCDAAHDDDGAGCFAGAAVEQRCSDARRRRFAAAAKSTACRSRHSRNASGGGPALVPMALPWLCCVAGRRKTRRRNEWLNACRKEIRE